MVLSRRLFDSLKLAFTLVTGVATFFTVLGFSMKDGDMLFENKLFSSILNRAVILIVVFFALVLFIWVYKYFRYRTSICVSVGKNNVFISEGNIFDQDSWRVIPMDTRFETTVDDLVIRKSSLHGQLVLEHGSAEEIRNAVDREAVRRGLKKNTDGYYDFPLGTVIPYEGIDGKYLMLAFTSLNDDMEAHTTMVQYEPTLMVMWREILRVYEQYDVSLPLIGNGITRFDDNQDEPERLLHCMLCTLNISKVHLKSTISIVIHRDDKDSKSLTLYDYKESFKTRR